MSHEFPMPIVLIAFAAGAGLMSWSGEVRALPAALVFPLVWSHCRSRTAAALCSAAYFLAASRGLPHGVANFYGVERLAGYGLWILASAGFVAAYTVAWIPRETAWRTLRFGIAAAAMAVPPLGIVGWAHPVTVAGVLFPGWSWAGLSATIILVLLLTTPLWMGAVAAVAAVWICSIWAWTPARQPDGWVGLHTEYGEALGRGFDLHVATQLAVNIHTVETRGARIALLPESALGFWTPTLGRFWQQQLEASNVIVVGGAAIISETGYDNVLMVIDGEGGRRLYRERMPVPIAMWQPWLSLSGKTGGADAAFFANPVVDLAGSRIAPLICYEQLLVWPILQSMLFKPDLIVAVGNGWWTQGTSIMAIQRASSESWARLFNVPIVYAVNT